MSVNHEDKLVENVSNLMTCDSFNDVRIRLSNGVQVEANKVILAAMSTFFCKEIQENVTNTYDGKFLEINVDISCAKEMLDLVIKYFYTGKVNYASLSLKDLLDLIHLLVFLQMEVLATLVEKFVMNKIRKGGFLLEKLLILSSTAEAFEFKAIVSTMVSYFSLNINQVSELPEVKYISYEILEKLLKEAEDLEGIVQKEVFFPKFQTVRSWIAGNDVNDEVRMKLISMFDLKNFTVQRLTSAVRESKLFSESSILDVLSKTVHGLELEVECLKKTSIEKRKSIVELNSKIEMLEKAVTMRDQKLTSIGNSAKEMVTKANEKANIANEKANRANEELKKANSMIKELKMERTKFSLENTTLKLSRARLSTNGQ